MNKLKKVLLTLALVTTVVPTFTAVTTVETQAAVITKTVTVTTVTKSRPGINYYYNQDGFTGSLTRKSMVTLSTGEYKARYEGKVRKTI